MRVAWVALFSFATGVQAAVHSAVKPAWETCSLKSKPKAQSLQGGPADTARELEDAKLVTANAMRLHAKAKAEKAANNIVAAARDEADVNKQLKQAADETMATLSSLAHEAAAAVVSHAKSTGPVKAVDSDSLASMMSKNRNVLIVFYAPWCPHCQDFVMAENAPLESLNTRIVAAAKPAGPDVVKFDVDAGQVPAGFDVQAIPTIYLFNHGTGAKMAYEGQSDLDSLEAWALNGGVAPMKEMPRVVVLKTKANSTAFLQRSKPPAWGAMNDIFSKIQGKPTREQAAHKASILSVKKHQKEVMQAEDEKEEQLESASPLSKLSLAPNQPVELGGAIGKYLK